MARWLLLVGVAWMLSGCGALAGPPAPTPRPVATVTPMSTPLIYPPTPLPIGSRDNPLRWAFVPADPQAAEADREAFERALNDALQASVQVELAATMAEVIEAVCSSTLDQATLGTLDALGYAIVSARGCATPAMRLVGASGAGDAILIVSRQAESLEAVRSLNLPFCRINSADPESWLLPTLLVRTLRQEESVLGQPLDQQDHAESLRTMNGGGCWGTAIPARVYDPLREADDLLVQGVRVLARTPELPFGVVMIPTTLPLETRERLITLLEAATRADNQPQELASGSEATPEAVAALSELARPLLGDFRLVAVGANDLEAVDRFFSQTQLDFARLGG